MKCEVCKKHEASKSSVIADYYYKNICGWCYTKLTKFNSPSSGSAEYDRGRDSEEHEADQRQPYTDGKPDATFIHLYPEAAAKLFTQEEIDQANRS